MNQFRHLVGLLGRVKSPSQGLYLHWTKQHRNTRKITHSCVGFESTVALSKQTKPTPRTARQLWPVVKQILLLKCSQLHFNFTSYKSVGEYLMSRWIFSNKRLRSISKLNLKSRVIFFMIRRWTLSDMPVVQSHIALCIYFQILYPDQFIDWYDLRLRHVDKWSKIHWPIYGYLAEQLNFRYEASVCCVVQPIKTQWLLCVSCWWPLFKQFWLLPHGKYEVLTAVRMRME